MYEDGYLGVTVNRDSSITRSINISVTSLAFLVLCIFGGISIAKIHRIGNINWRLNVSFLFSFACALFAILSLIIWLLLDILMIDSRQYAFPLFCLFLGLFFQSLLGTLILRLHITFDESVYHMPSALKFVFIVIMVLLFVSMVVIIGLAPFVTESEFMYVAFRVVIPWFSLYSVGCVLAVYYFISSLSHLAKAMEASVRDLKISPEQIKLEKPQEKLANLAAKYMMLFAIAMCSTMLTNILGFSVNENSGLKYSLYAIDLCVNMQCIYLQFSFANNEYTTWCGSCDVRCRRTIKRKTQRMIHQHSVDLMKSISESRRDDNDETVASEIVSGSK